MQNKIIVTGSSGFIGSSLLQSLRYDHGLKCIGVSRRKASKLLEDVSLDLCNLLVDDKICADVSAIIHAAGSAHRKLRKKDLRSVYSNNVRATVSLAKCAKKAGVKKFIFLSSVAVYGKSSHDEIITVDEVDPRDIYGRSKYFAETLLRKIFIHSNTELVIIRLPIVIGENPPGNLGMICKMAKRNIPIPLSLATSNKRTYIDCSDLNKVIYKYLTNEIELPSTCIIGARLPISTYEMVSLVLSKSDLKTKFLPLNTRLIVFILRLIGRRKMAAQLFGNLEFQCFNTDIK